jgi:plastocyanin
MAVAIVNFGFQPTPLSAAVSDDVTWTNTTTSTPHTVTRCDANCPVGPGSGTDAGFGSTASIAGGATYSHTFTASGTYIYYCQVHGYAAMHGEVDVTSPLLRVTSSPALASQIMVDGQIADSWGLTWLKLAPGSHAVSFTHVEGYTEPAPQTVTLNPGATTTVAGGFTQRGFVHVSSSPAVASQITFDGHPTDDWGMFTDVPVGTHAVCFGAVAGFTPPPCQNNVSVTAGSLTNVTGTFTSCTSCTGQAGMGLMRVASSPAVATQITIKPSAGSPYIADTWGINWLELAPGSYTVSFGHVQGWTEPAPQTVSITAGNTTVVPANFTQRGELHVFTSPAVAGTVLVDGVARDDWGMFTDVPTGSHTVCFGAAAGFANTPACQTVSVNAGVETDVTGTYS